MFVLRFGALAAMFKPLCSQRAGFACYIEFARWWTRGLLQDRRVHPVRGWGVGIASIHDLWTLCFLVWSCSFSYHQIRSELTYGIGACLAILLLHLHFASCNDIFHPLPANPESISSPLALGVCIRISEVDGSGWIMDLRDRGLFVASSRGCWLAFLIRPGVLVRDALHSSFGQLVCSSQQLLTPSEESLGSR